MSTSVSDLIELETINKNIRVLGPDMTYCKHALGF